MRDQKAQVFLPAVLISIWRTASPCAPGAVRLTNAVNFLVLIPFLGICQSSYVITCLGRLVEGVLAFALD